MLLLDTNVLIWMETGDSRLGLQAMATIDQAAASRTALICPISWWEAGMAMERGRTQMKVDLAQWRRNLLGAGYVEHAITGMDTIEMLELQDFNKDPADRLIVAVARVGGFTLITADREILGWRGNLDRRDSRE